MKRLKNFKILSRSTAVIVTAVLIVAGVAFALLQSQQDTITGNVIEAPNADMRISANGSAYINTVSGFDFNYVIPGGPAQPVAGNSFFIKNSGSEPLALKFAVTSVPTNPDNVDLSKVHVLLTTVGSSNGPQSFTLQSLIASAASGGISLDAGTLDIGNVQQFKLQVALNADAMSGPSFDIGNLDFAFTGVAVPN